MAQYIDKSTVVAEIERRIASLESIGSENYLHDNHPEQYAMLVTLKSLKFSIDNLEVKEVESNDACIEKAINFLNYKLDDVVAIRAYDTIIPHHVVKQELIEDFKNYMKGE